MKAIMWIVGFVLMFAVVTLSTRWIFNAVMATDWPDWVKYLILVR